MRDHDLVQAQSQLDGIAAAMASALSDTTTAGSPVAGGFQVDVGSLSAGNTVTVNYTDTATSTARTITLVRVDDPSLLPLSNDATAATGDTVYGIDFSGGMAAAVAQINAAIGSAGLVASNPSGTLLRVVDDGTSTATVNAVSATTTATALTGGTALPFFTDGGGFYTGAITALGSQSIGLAGRIAVNAALVADPSKLVLYQAGTRRRRQHAAGFHLPAAHFGEPDLLAGWRHRQRQRAVHRLDRQLSAPGASASRAKRRAPPTISSRARTSCCQPCNSASTNRPA